MTPTTAPPTLSLAMLLRLAFLTAFLATSPAPAWAWDLSGYGLRGGVSLARLHGDGGEAIGSEYRMGGQAGLHAVFRLADRFSLQSEVGWVSKGGEQTIEGVAVGSPDGPAYPVARIENTLDYIEISVLARAGAPVGSLELYALAGPALAFRISDHREVVFENPPPLGATRIRFAQIYERLGTAGGDFDVDPLDAGLTGGLGLLFGRSRFRFGLEARYTGGLVNVLPSDEFEVRNGSFALTTVVEIRR